jgi:tRNA pseudouridine38-40 synthase
MDKRPARRYRRSMPRYALLIDYHGGPFRGWQRQDGQPSVQEAVETALRRIEPDVAPVQGAGRTDTGVHATGQVAHVDLPRAWDPFRLAEALNAHLRPLPVAVLATALVADSFHARFSAVERRYTYRILNRRAPLTHDAGLAWRVQARLDADAMGSAAQALVGRHDFTTFRAAMCQAASPVKTLDEIRIETQEVPGGQEIRLHLRARSFLHNQVRSIVGSLERVGAGAWPEARIAEALAACDRAACGPVAPPEGLCLTRVVYPADPFKAG